MAEHDSTLDTIYQNWAVYQSRLVRALAPLSDEQLAMRLAPHVRSIGQIARHIVGARGYWLSEIMGEGGDAIALLATWNSSNVPERSAAELIAGLETTGTSIQSLLAQWSSADMEYVYRGVSHGEPYADVRRWIIWHLIEHDIHHGGELSLTLGVHRLTAHDL